MPHEGSHKIFGIWDQFRSFSPPSADPIDTHRDAATHPAIFLLKSHGIRRSSWSAQRVSKPIAPSLLFHQKNTAHRGWGGVHTRVFLRHFFVAVCPQYLLKGEVSAGEVCLHLTFTCELAPGPDCAWRLGRARVGRLKWNRKTCTCTFAVLTGAFKCFVRSAWHSPVNHRILRGPLEASPGGRVPASPHSCLHAVSERY